MGFFEKVKGWFEDDYHDEEEAEEIIAEKSKVEITNPKVAEKEDVTDAEVLKKEEKPEKFIFDEKEFDELISNEAVKKAKKNYANQKKEPKVFRPTPIISPVYGILDKNYVKEDIAPKRRKTGELINEMTTGDIDVDWIRKKAYGTLDDDLEQELFKEKHVLVDENFEEEKDFFEELDENEKQNNGAEKQKNDEQKRSDKYEQEENGNKNKEEVSEEENQAKMLEDSFFYEKKETVDESQDNNENEEVKEKEAEENIEVANTENDSSDEQKEEQAGTELFDLVDNMYKKEGD